MILVVRIPFCLKNWSKLLKKFIMEILYLPIDILGLLALNLEQEDVLRFRLTCSIFDDIFTEIWLFQNVLRCYSITDREIFLMSSSIKYLDLEDCYKITNIGIGFLPHGLKHLNLSHCEDITDEGLKILPQGLKHLNLSYCRKITDEGLQFLSQFPDLNIQF